MPDENLVPDGMFGDEGLDASTPIPADPGQPRTPDGKFASTEVAPSNTQPVETAPAPVVAAPIQTTPADKPKIDPEQFKGYLDEREKRQKLETEIAELKRQQQANQQPARIPSVNDPDFVDFQRQELARVQTETRFDLSETMATEKHGEVAVKSAMDWAMDRAQQSPAFAAEYIRQKHPIDWAVRQQKRDATLNDIGDDPDAYVRRRAAELGLVTGATPTEAAPGASPVPTQPNIQQPVTPPPPKSLAHANTAGGLTSEVVYDDFAGLDMFKKRHK